MLLTEPQLKTYLGALWQPDCEYKISTHQQARQKVLEGWIAVTAIPDNTESGTNVILADSTYQPPNFPPVEDQPQVPVTPVPKVTNREASDLHRLNLELTAPLAVVELLELLYETPATKHDKPKKKAARKKAARVAKAAMTAADPHKKKFTFKGLLTWADPDPE